MMRLDPDRDDREARRIAMLVFFLSSDGGAWFVTGPRCSGTAATSRDGGHRDFLSEVVEADRYHEPRAIAHN